MLRTSTTTDEQLLTNWRAGDTASGNALFERYYGPLHRFFSNKVPEPNELIQATFEGVVKSSQQSREISGFRGFLFGVARHKLSRHFRERARDRGFTEVDDLSLHDLDRSPSACIAERQDERLLLEALRRLPLDTQVLVELRFWEKLKIEELAELYNRPMGTISTRLRRALQLLRGHLAELETSPQRLDSTLTTIAGWAERLRGDESDATEG